MRCQDYLKTEPESSQKGARNISGTSQKLSRNISKMSQEHLRNISKASLEHLKQIPMRNPHGNSPWGFPMGIPHGIHDVKVLITGGKARNTKLRSRPLGLGDITSLYFGQIYPISPYPTYPVYRVSADPRSRFRRVRPFVSFLRLSSLYSYPLCLSPSQSRSILTP